ncbi:interaptin-like [Chrysoperla carnea]|uniref:interaptin-like n=1 Tax=Chrysoperla carnea TaxID=189513 RepID=UPI001D06DD17|nr:interaptin-like [Chrysoperla carnea]
METVKNLTGQLRVQISEIEVLKHNIEKEMKENLQINERKSRIENDYTNTTKQIAAEEERLQTLSAELNNQRMIIKFTEGDLNQANTANQEREFELNQIIKDIEKQTLLKVSLEDEIMNHLDECDTNDKAAAHLSKFVRQLKEKCRQLEIKMLNAENTDAKLLVEIEQLKGSNTANID